MTDYFALLNEPRRPWLDLDELRAKFLALSGQAHPDKFHASGEAEKLNANKKFAELNMAYNTLRDPKERLGHLLQLELGAMPKDIQRLPSGTMDLFLEVGQLCRDADAFLSEKAKVTSPLLKVQTFQKGMEWTDKLSALQQKISALYQNLLDELKTMNESWASIPENDKDRPRRLPLERLEQIYRALSYFRRWTEQVQERQVQLSL
jgi:curved DNA-binding protein CbpA